ncbi:MAG: ECF transporter S component [Clostridia bacterium]|nr:ECF transporter S component [Clostridia bacterium]
MKNTQSKRIDTRTLVLGAVFTALVIILQLMGAFIKFGPFSISLVLIPIVLGAATCGILVGAWLGLVFGIVVLASGDAASFMAVDAFGTVLTVLLKGVGCGLASGAVYKLVYSFMKRRSEKKISGLVDKKLLCKNCEYGMVNYFSRNSQYVAVLAAAIVCPLVNTGIFLLGCLVFFLDTIATWAAGAGFGDNVGVYIIAGFVGFNFLFELGTNIILSPVIVRLLNIRKKQN